MPKKNSLGVVDQSQGLIMTEEGLLIPGKFLRNMGEKIAVVFSPRLIVISPASSSHRTRKRESRKADR